MGSVNCLEILNALYDIDKNSFCLVKCCLSILSMMKNQCYITPDHDVFMLFLKGSKMVVKILQDRPSIMGFLNVDEFIEMVFKMAIYNYDGEHFQKKYFSENNPLISDSDYVVLSDFQVMIRRNSFKKYLVANESYFNIVNKSKIFSRKLITIVDVLTDKICLEYILSYL